MREGERVRGRVCAYERAALRVGERALACTGREGEGEGEGGREGERVKARSCAHGLALAAQRVGERALACVQKEGGWGREGERARGRVCTDGPAAQRVGERGLACTLNGGRGRGGSRGSKSMSMDRPQSMLERGGVRVKRVWPWVGRTACW